MTGASRRVGVCRTAGNRNYLTGWGRLGWRLGGGRGGCDTRCSPRLAIRDAGLQWGNERELRESVANHEVEVVCVAAGASESSFAGLLGWRGGFRLCWVNRGIGPVVHFFREWSWAACAAEGADVPAPAGMGDIAAVEAFGSCRQVEVSQSRD